MMMNTKCSVSVMMLFIVAHLLSATQSASPPDSSTDQFRIRGVSEGSVSFREGEETEQETEQQQKPTVREFNRRKSMYLQAASNPAVSGNTGRNLLSATSTGSLFGSANTGLWLALGAINFIDVFTGGWATTLVGGTSQTQQQQQILNLLAALQASLVEIDTRLSSLESQLVALEVETRWRDVAGSSTPFARASLGLTGYYKSLQDVYQTPSSHSTWVKGTSFETLRADTATLLQQLTTKHQTGIAAQYIHEVLASMIGKIAPKKWVNSARNIYNTRVRRYTLRIQSSLAMILFWADKASTRVPQACLSHTFQVCKACNANELSCSRLQATLKTWDTETCKTSKTLSSLITNTPDSQTNMKLKVAIIPDQGGNSVTSHFGSRASLYRSDSYELFLFVGFVQCQNQYVAVGIKWGIVNNIIYPHLTCAKWNQLRGSFYYTREEGKGQLNQVLYASEEQKAKFLKPLSRIELFSFVGLNLDSGFVQDGPNNNKIFPEVPATEIKYTSGGTEYTLEKPYVIAGVQFSIQLQINDYLKIKLNPAFTTDPRQSFRFYSDGRYQNWIRTPVWMEDNNKAWFDALQGQYEYTGYTNSRKEYTHNSMYNENGVHGRDTLTSVYAYNNRVHVFVEDDLIGFQSNTDNGQGANIEPLTNIGLHISPTTRVIHWIARDQPGGIQCTFPTPACPWNSAATPLPSGDCPWTSQDDITP